MKFTVADRASLLAMKGVGPKVLERFEQMGICTMAQLAEADPADLLAQGAKLSGSTCWKNSPQARAAIAAAIAAAVASVHQKRSGQLPDDCPPS